MQIGQLTIEMAANVARLRQDMDAAKNTVNAAMVNIQKSVNVAKGALAGLGAALSVGAFAAWIKSSIDAADEMSKLAQKTGVAVKDLAGLQLAYRQSGLEAGALQQSMSKLAVGVLNGNDALKAMSIQTRNADGSLKSTREVLGLVADQFASYQDGIGKTALAIELFGKSGADLIPMLNGGSEALAEFDEMARKLGLTMDEETAKNAEKFNDTLDLLGQGMSGISRQVAGNLLPTLTGLAGEFLNSMTSGDRLKNVADVLSAALRGLYVAGIGIVEVFSTVGKTLGGVSAAVVAALSGDFAGAANILKEMKADIGQGWVESLEAAKRAFTTTGNAGVDAMVAVAGASKKAAPEVGEVAKAAKKTTDEFEALLAKINGKDVGIDSDFYKNLAILKDGLDKGRISLEQYVATVETYIRQQKFYQDELKRSAEQTEEYFKAEEKERLEKEKAIGSAREMLEQIEFETAALQMTNQEREIAVKLRELERVGIKKYSEEYAVMAEKIKAAVIGKEAVEASIEQQKKARDEWAKTWDQVGQSLTDSLMQGGKSAADYIKGLFRSMVLKPMLQPIVGGVLASLGLGGAGPAAAAEPGSIASALGLGNTISAIKGVYSAVTSGFSALGDTVAFAAQDIGTWLLQNTTGVLNSAGTTIMQAAGTLGTVASYATGALAGYGIGTAISGQFEAFGNKNVATIAGTAIGAIFGGPLGAAIGGAIGGVVNRAFGRGAKETQDMGISGTFGSSGASVQQFSNWRQKGGWFRSDRSGTDTSAISGELQTMLDVALQATAATVRQYVGLLGMSADAVDGYSQAISISLQGLTAEQQEKAIADALSGFGDTMVASLYAEVLEVARTGETAGTTLSRLASSIQTVNGVFDVLNLRLIDASVYGADAASKLLDLFGGAQGFVQATDFFYQNFYTEAERAAKTTEQLGAAMGALGLSLPATREGFRALVIAAREAGDSQLFARLMALAPAFASIVPEIANVTTEVAMLENSLESLNAAFDRAKSATDAAMSEVERSISAASAAAEKSITDTFNALTKTLTAQKEAAEAARQAASENVSAIRGVFELLKTQIADLVGEAGAGMSAAQGRAFIEQAIGTARSTGYLPEQAQLGEAIAAARAGLNSAAYATAFELRRDRLVLAGKLGELQAVSGDQLTIAERHLAAAEDQLQTLQARLEQARAQYEADIAQNKAYYDAMLQAAQAQIDAMRGVNNSVLGLSAAMLALAQAIAAEAAAGSAVKNASMEQWTSNNGQSTWTSSGGAVATATGDSGYVINAINGQQFTGAYAAGWVQEQLAAGDAMTVYNGALATGISANSLDAIMGWTPGTSNAWAVENNLPKFAAGGLHDGGMRLVGENGPELEVSGPARYYSASETSGMLAGGTEVANEVRQLRNENQAQARAMVQLQSRMTRLLERWDGDGLPEERNVAA